LHARAGEYVLQLVPKEGITAAALSTNDVVLVLDTAVTPELEAEGVAQRLRAARAAGAQGRGAARQRPHRAVGRGRCRSAGCARLHTTYVQEQVLAKGITFGAPAAGAFVAEGKVGSGAGAPVKIGVEKK
jgi:isoleucyl-tRNA synthetase